MGYIKLLILQSDGTTGFWCFFSFANAYDPANPGFGETSSADCIDQ